MAHNEMFFRRMIGVSLISFVIAFPLIAGGFSIMKENFRISYSPQSISCLPWHWYIEHVRPVRNLYPGEIVMARAQKAFDGAEIGKLVIGLPGDIVKETRKGIWVNGHFWGRMWLENWLKATGSIVPRIPETYRIPKGKALLLGTDSQSWDGRYWGLVTDKEIRGTMQPI